MMPHDRILELINDGLSRLAGARAAGDMVVVTTHCMYPSNGLVRVFVKAGRDTAIVSDEGEALGEALSSGISINDPDRTVRHLVTASSLKISLGIIHSGPVPLSALPVAVLLVANAARDVATWLYEHHRFKRRRDFRRSLSEYLSNRFDRQVVHGRQLVGASHKKHRFANVIELPDERRIVIDSVTNEPSSINARAIANMDLRQLNDPRIEQRIVYDETERWSAADLNLLKIGATPVAYSRVGEVVERIVDARPGFSHFSLNDR